MNELALFAGAGGGTLAGEILGDRTVCAVEIDPFAAGVLARRQNDGHLPTFPIWDDVRTFDGKPWRGVVDVVSGGFPCQDISAAGPGGGLAGARSGLWREMVRIVREVGPGFVRVENSPMLTSRGLGVVLGDLAALGFDAEWDVLSAADLGAPHLRERIWIVARHPLRARLSVARAQSHGTNGRDTRRMFAPADRWPAESGLVRVANGIPGRMDRIRALGNAQVPRVAAAAFAALAAEHLSGSDPRSDAK